MSGNVDVVECVEQLRRQGVLAVTESANLLRKNEGLQPLNSDGLETQTATVTFPAQRRTNRVWGDEVVIAETPAYTGKLLYRYGFEPYHRGGLQWHPDRDEDAHLVWGEAIFYWVDGDVLRKRRLAPGMSVHIPKGVAHSFETIGNSLVYETSTPGTTPAIRVEEQYDITQAIES